MNEEIGADSPYTSGGMTITPIFRSRTTVHPGGGMGEKEPLGLLIHTGTTLRIVSFTKTSAWWDELTNAYPGLHALQTVLQETPPETRKK